MIQRMVKIHMNGMKLLDTILLGETDNVRMEVAVVCYIIWKKCILLKTHSFLSHEIDNFISFTKTFPVSHVSPTNTRHTIL